MRFKIIKPASDDALKISVAEMLVRRVEELTGERNSNSEMLERIASRNREIDRELADCRATANFFHLLLVEPEDGERERLVGRLIHYQKRLAQEEDTSLRALHHRRIDEYSDRIQRLDDAIANCRVRQASLAPEAPPAGSPASQKLDRGPKIRDLVMDRLKVAGEQGSKAAPIHAWIKETYGLELHSKTIGMTLYRLSQDGLVHREGQTWFYRPQAGQTLPASTKNPGAGAPGQIHEAD